MSEAAERWNESYVDGVPPWDVDHPDELLQQAVQDGTITAGHAIDLGCGTGTNARFLHQHGFQVVGVDFAPLAIERARERSPDAIAFHVHDILAEPLPGGPYQVAFDRGCFHVFSDEDERALFVKRVAAALAPGGLWLSLVGSTEGPAREQGPPRRSARDLVRAIEPELEIVALRAAGFDSVAEGIRSWVCLSRKRTVLAQPSTRNHH